MMSGIVSGKGLKLICVCSMVKGYIKCNVNTVISGFKAMTGDKLWVTPSDIHQGTYYFHFRDYPQWCDDNVSPSVFRNLYDKKFITIVTNV